MQQVRVLLVEDDEDDYVLTAGLLSEMPGNRFAVDWVDSYDSALEKISHHHDVCLLDYRLGKNTGLELLRKAREQGYNAPVIMLTGQGDNDVDIAAMQAGAADYLIKGQIDAPALERAIRYAIEQKRSTEARLQLVREQQARAIAEEANRSKDEFLATLAHELRSPLQAMLGWVQVLRLGAGDENDRARALDAIERNAQMQTQFVDDLLDVSRIMNDGLRLELRPIELTAVVESAIEAAQPAAQAKSIALKVALDRSIGRVMGDARRLQQIVGNLLSNAIKFTPARGHIEVTLLRGGAGAELIVTDSGKGISRDLLPHIFERYRQSADAKADRHAGLGLGLAIVRQLAEMHRGTVTAESYGDGHGATFTLTLPLAPGDS